MAEMRRKKLARAAGDVMVVWLGVNAYAPLAGADLVRTSA